MHSRERSLLASSRPSVHMYHSSSHRWIAVNLDIRDFYGNLPRKSQFCCNHTKISDTLHEDLHMSCSCWQHSIVTKTLVSHEMVSGCWDSRRGIDITQTHRNVMLYTHRLSSPTTTLQFVCPPLSV